MEKIDKNLDLARELKKKLRNMKMIVILILVGFFETVPKRKREWGTGDQNQNHPNHSTV